MTNRKLHISFRLAPTSMTLDQLDDLELDGGRPPLFSNTQTIIISGCVQHIYMILGSRVGFLGSADLMLRLSISKMQVGGWRPSWIYKNGHNFVIALPIDVTFGSRVGFPAELKIYFLGLHTHTAVARNPCVS